MIPGVSFGEPYLLLLSLLALPVLYIGFRNSSRYKKVIGATRALLLVLLAVALASPSINVQEQRSQQPEAVILEDNSRSTQVMQETDLNLEGIRTETRTIASGNSSDLRNAILQNTEQDSVYLLKSDLRSSSSLQGVGERFERRNSTVHLLEQEVKEEQAVRITGPDTTYPGVENSFTVKIDSTGDYPEPEVSVNGETVELENMGEGEWSFSRTFNEQGSNTVEASIRTEDEINENNRYYHTVKVSEKPEILVLGDQGRIGQEFEDFYSFDYREEVPSDLSDYYTVVAKKEFPESDLSGYVAEGNGLIYTGDIPETSTVLPVRRADYQDRGITMMLLIDASQGGNPEERLKRTKSVAYMLLDSQTLPPGSRVGALYYNQEPYLISKPKPLAENNHREKLQGGITRIPVGGNSLHHRAIRAGQQAIEGEGNLMLISDGEISALGDYYNDTRNARELAENSEEKIISVMVGESPNQNFLGEIATLSGGYSIKDLTAQEISFQGGGASGDAVSLIKNDETHFITQGISIESTTSGFQGAEPKRGAKQLVTGTNSEPFLTTWRYGLGRVAAFTAGEDDLGAIMFRDSELVSRTLSWSVADPNRKKENWIEIENGQAGEEVEVRSSYRIEGLNQQSEELYTGSLNPEELGFHEFNDTVYSYNYNEEVKEVGYGNIQEFAQSTGGEVFEPDQEQEIAEAVRSFSNEKVNKNRDLSNFFLAAALLVFLTEIGYRKRKGKK